MNLITTNTLQQRYLLNPNPKFINILATGRGAGNTTALFIKSLIGECPNSVFIYPITPMAHQAAKDYRKFLDGLDMVYEFNITDNSFKYYYCKKEIDVTFANKDLHKEELACQTFMGKWRGGYSGNVFIERPELCNQTLVDFYIDKSLEGNVKDLTFVTSPIDCAWRNFKYVKGIKTEEVLESSWDSKLLVWDNQVSERAKVSEYLDKVSVITNIGADNNMFMDNVYGLLGKLNPPALEIEPLLEGKWIV